MLKNCSRCKHYMGKSNDLYVCRAYPNGIPERLLSDELVHNALWLQDTPFLFEEKGTSAGDSGDELRRREVRPDYDVKKELNEKSNFSREDEPMTGQEDLTPKSDEMSKKSGKYFKK